MGNDREKIKAAKYKEKKKGPSENAKRTDRTPAGAVVWRILKPVIGIAIALVVVGFGLKFAFNYAYGHYFAPVDENDTSVKEVVIEKGSSLSQIADTLEEEGIIRSSTVFKLYVDFSDMSSKLLAGTFELSPSMEIDDIIKVLKRPTSINDTMRITFVEGSNVEDMAEHTAEVGLFDKKDEYLAAAKTGEAFLDYDFIKDVIVANGKSNYSRDYVLEGYLFPDTYEVYTETDAATVINKQLTRFSQIFTDEYKARAEELGFTVDQVVTLASIIEKEGSGEDMPKISAVFHNRLKKNMPLQSDATIMYILKEKRLVVTTEETQIDSPYNTYINTGLPIGPICNPSAAAIEAALYPDEEILNGGYLYFCLGDPETGEVFYTKTLEEHAAIQAKYKDKWAELDKQNASKEQ